MSTFNSRPCRLSVQCFLFSFSTVSLSFPPQMDAQGSLVEPCDSQSGNPESALLSLRRPDFADLQYGRRNHFFPETPEPCRPHPRAMSSWSQPPILAPGPNTEISTLPSPLNGPLPSLIPSWIILLIQTFLWCEIIPAQPAEAKELAPAHSSWPALLSCHVPHPQLCSRGSETPSDVLPRLKEIQTEWQGHGCPAPSPAAPVRLLAQRG